jgi:hypothetical protein
MNPQLQAQLELLDRKTEPFASRSNAVGEAITAIRDTIAMMAKGQAVEEPVSVVEPVEPETSETEAKKSRKS